VGNGCYCEGLRTPAPVCAAPPSWGRHPQTFTFAPFWRPAINFRSTPRTGHGADPQDCSAPCPRGSKGRPKRLKTAPASAECQLADSRTFSRQACWRLRYHRAMAKQYCSSSSLVARHVHRGIVFSGALFGNKHSNRSHF
jgi:hypothetical protein